MEFSQPWVFLIQAQDWFSRVLPTLKAGFVVVLPHQELLGSVLGLNQPWL
jgi:hypothetical protein